jgi:hypothetical protein
MHASYSGIHIHARAAHAIPTVVPRRATHIGGPASKICTWQSNLAAVGVSRQEQSLSISHALQQARIMAEDHLRLLRRDTGAGLPNQWPATAQII